MTDLVIRTRSQNKPSHILNENSIPGILGNNNLIIEHHKTLARANTHTRMYIVQRHTQLQTNKHTQPTHSYT